MTIWLLDRGADPNARCDIDYTPLSYAVKFADLPTIDLLLRRGGNVRKGQLMHNAIYRESYTLKVVKDLIPWCSSQFSYVPRPSSFLGHVPFYEGNSTTHGIGSEKRRRYSIPGQQGSKREHPKLQGSNNYACADEGTRRQIMQEIQSRGGLHASL